MLPVGMEALTSAPIRAKRKGPASGGVKGPGEGKEVASPIYGPDFRPAKEFARRPAYRKSRQTPGRILPL